jgi:N,N'-diacetyllegionaminate synthase
VRELAIAGRKLGDAHPPFIVAEAGINHNGKLDTALAMVHAAKHARCDAIKFATLKAAEFCNPEHMIEYQYQGRKVVETELEMFQRCELSEEAWHVIKRECDRVGIIFFSTPQNESDLRILLDVGVPAIKVGSDDLTNLTLIQSYADAHALPVILSTGMADFRDIRAAAHIGENTAPK